MALTRKQWNNIIILASILMVSVLTLLDKRMNSVPDTHELFDSNTELQQLQLGGIWLAQAANGQWQCDPKVLNCADWSQAWLSIRVSPLASKPELTQDERPRELLLKVSGAAEPQLWLFYPHQGLLKSAAGNWYLIPPSLRSGVVPLLSVSTS